MSAIQCPYCQSAIPAEDVNIKLVLAKCRQCHAVFRFAGNSPGGNDLAVGDGDALGFRSRPSTPVERPRSVRQVDGVTELLLRVSWYNAGVWIMVFFCLFWDSFMIAWYSIAFFTGAWMMAVFGLLHLAVGVGLTYSVALTFLNTTRIRVDRTQLVVDHGPLPTMLSVVALNSPDVRQLFVAPSGTTFELYAELNDDSRVKLLGVRSLDEGHYLEQQIETFLNIADRPVRGEA